MKLHQKVSVILITILGLSGPCALFLNQLPLLAQIQGLGVVPIPLVFDAPQGFQFWSNQSSYLIKTNLRDLPDQNFNSKIYQQFPRHSIIHNSLLIPFAMFPLFPENYNQNIGKKIFCSSDWGRFFLPIDLKIDEKIFSIKIKTHTETKNWEMEIQCL